MDEASPGTATEVAVGKVSAKAKKKNNKKKNKNEQ
jgi:hypothetical protein